MREWNGWRIAMLAAGMVGACLPDAGRAAETAAVVRLEAGVETNAVLPPLGKTMRVYLPANYTPDQKWPAIFYYHGMNGQPTTAPLRDSTDGRDFIIVGMPYAVDNGQSPLPGGTGADPIQRELANLRAARAWLGRQASVDEDRVFLGGISMGGWSTTLLGERELPRLAGLIVLLAGRQRPNAVLRDIAAIRDKPVYLGSGETDPNLIPALLAADFYRRHGARVTLEVYAGVGHDVPRGPKRLKQWLETQGPYRQGPQTDSMRAALQADIDTQWQQIRQETNALIRYRQLLDLAQDPRLPLAAGAPADEAAKQLAALRQKSPAKEEWLAEVAFHDLAWQDANVKTLAEMKAVCDGFRKLCETYPQTWYGKLGARYYERIAAAYEKSVAATRQANPSPRSAGAATPSSAINFPVDETSARAPGTKKK